MVRVELRRPVEHDGKRIAVVEYDLDAVTADDLIAALQRAEAEAAGGSPGGTIGLQAMRALVSRLSGVHYDALGKLHPSDFAAAVEPTGAVFAPFLDLLAR